jgi:alpha,alpha-trehalase
MPNFYESNLFHDVQMSELFTDGKTFVDCIPKTDFATILDAYESNKANPSFKLDVFIRKNFSLPKEGKAIYESDKNRPIEEHIKSLWKVLTRKPSKQQNQGSLLPLEYPYIVPGGRFREVYYWDSYFTMLGLKAHGEVKLMQHIVENFANLITHIGYIPNGNRAYYIGRSQPPFFVLMVKLLSEVKGEVVLQQYLSELEDEWVYWNNAAFDEGEIGVKGKMVKLNEEMFQLRYFDENNTPRPESYREDVMLAQENDKQASETLYAHLRAAAESGWDFSHRWFAEKADFGTIHTTDILPVDLNCLNYYLTKTLSEIYAQRSDKESKQKAALFQYMAQQMQQDIQTLYWNENEGFFVDYDFVKKEQRNILTLAGVFPLFFGIATQAQAQAVATNIEKSFLQIGGLTTSLYASGQQWDAPNGWAPLQWITFEGVRRYGFHELAEKIAKRWLHTCEQVYLKTGKMTEKYDVWNPNAAASGGEYPNQDGFGWTNGVYLALKNAISI